MIAELTAHIPPWFGTIWDARSVGQEWAEIVVQGRRHYDVGNRDYIMESGAPLTALGAMRSCLRDEILNSAADASISTAAFFLKTFTAKLDTGVFTGPAIGLAEASAKLARKVAHLGFQYRAAKALREAIRDPAGLDITVFRTYPLLGAYFLHCADLSSLIPLRNRYTPGWQSAVEKMKRDGDNIFVASDQLIDACPFKIVGIQKIKKNIDRSKHMTTETIWSYSEDLRDATADMIQTAVGQTT